MPEITAPERIDMSKNAVSIDDRGIMVTPSNQNIKRIIPIVIYLPYATNTSGILRLKHFKRCIQSPAVAKGHIPHKGPSGNQGY